MIKLFPFIEIIRIINELEWVQWLERFMVNNRNGNYLSSRDRNLFLTIFSRVSKFLSLLFHIMEIGMETIDFEFQCYSSQRRIDSFYLRAPRVARSLTLHCKQTTLSRSSFHRFSITSSSNDIVSQTNPHETKTFSS